MAERSSDIQARWTERAARTPLWLRRLGGGLLVYLAAYFLVDADAVRHATRLTPTSNSNVAEAEAILHGRLDLRVRTFDTALFRGKVYNVFPPMLTGIALAVLWLTSAGIPPLVLLAVALPLPGLAYALFLRRTAGITTAAVLSICYIAGTSFLPVLNLAFRNGEVWYVNHLLSQWGLLVFLLDWFGRRRLWLGAMGLLIAFWSRQITLMYMAPLLLAALGEGATSGRWRRAAPVGLVTMVAVALPLLLNTLKFGHPLESGYRYLYAGRTDTHAVDVQQGLFALSFVPRNLYYMNLGFPEVEASGGMIRFKPDPTATGIWWTTPLLLYVFREWRRIWMDRAARRLLLASGAVFAILLLYHATGGHQWGFNRFSLDYVVVLLSLIAPCIDSPQRRKTAALLTGWSVWYFRWAI